MDESLAINAVDAIFKTSNNCQKLLTMISENDCCLNKITSIIAFPRVQIGNWLLPLELRKPKVAKPEYGALSLKEFRERGYNNSDIVQCFGLFPYFEKHLHKTPFIYEKMNKPYKEGILMTYKGTTRWVIVTNGFMITYKIQESQVLKNKPMMVIDLQECKVKVCPIHENALFVFELVTPFYSKKLSAQNVKEGHEWVWTIRMNSGNFF